jgi:hypothetical protein
VRVEHEDYSGRRKSFRESKKERLNDVRYQEFSEMTLDDVVARYIVKGHFILVITSFMHRKVLFYLSALFRKSLNNRVSYAIIDASTTTIPLSGGSFYDHSTGFPAHCRGAGCPYYV